MAYYTVVLSNLDDYSIVFEKSTKDFEEAFKMYSMLQGGLQKGYYLHLDMMTEDNRKYTVYKTSRDNK